MSDIKIGVIGAGAISREHMKVVQALRGTSLCGITSRTIPKAQKLAADFGDIPVYKTPTELVNKSMAQALLVLVSAENIFSVVQELCNLGLPLFLEKPPGLTPNETGILAEYAQSNGIKNMVGFNRRYYSVFHKGLDIINEHGPLMGLFVEGHERFWKIKGNVSQIIQEHWIFANSTHTIDLLRFFGGEPLSVHALARSYKTEKADQFSTTLAFKNGVVGNYSSHWYSPGGWSVRLFGDGVTVEFKPLENAHWQDINFKFHKILPESEDIDFKPGFFKQMESFVNLVRGKSLEWPAQDLFEAKKTMELTNKIYSG